MRNLLESRGAGEHDCMKMQKMEYQEKGSESSKRDVMATSATDGIVSVSVGGPARRRTRWCTVFSGIKWITSSHSWQILRSHLRQNHSAMYSSQTEHSSSPISRSIRWLPCEAILNEFKCCPAILWGKKKSRGFLGVCQGK